MSKFTITLANENIEIKCPIFNRPFYFQNVILGKEITITNGESSFTAKAVDVTESGALIVEENGVKKTIYAGDVSIRL